MVTEIVEIIVCLGSGSFCRQPLACMTHHLIGDKRVVTSIKVLSEKFRKQLGEIILHLDGGLYTPKLVNRMNTKAKTMYFMVDN